MNLALAGKKIAILATNGFEQSELERPRAELKEQGAQVDVVSPEKSKIRGWRDKNWGDHVEVDVMLGQLSIADYDALIIPGGVMNPDELRSNPTAVKVVKEAVSQGKVVAAICHGIWLLIEADAVQDKKLTSYHSLKTDVKNAGGRWSDESVVVDKGMVTSRNPHDLDAFIAKITEEILEGNHSERRIQSSGAQGKQRDAWRSRAINGSMHMGA